MSIREFHSRFGLFLGTSTGHTMWFQQQENELDIDLSNLSEDYIQDLAEFGIKPEDVIEPIRIESGKFIVLIIKQGLWATYKTADGFEIPDGAQRILSRATFIQSVPVKFPAPKDKRAFRRIVGASIELALLNDLEGSREMLSEAEGYVARRAAETSRFWYIQASLIATLLFVLFGVISENVSWDWSFSKEGWQHLGMATAFGAIGALFSFLQRLREHVVELGAGWKAHYGDAFVRILLGALGAFIFAIAFRAKFVMGYTAGGEDENILILYVFCVAAGFSERLVPDFLQQVELRALKDPTQGMAGTGRSLTAPQPTVQPTGQPATGPIVQPQPGRPMRGAVKPRR